MALRYRLAATYLGLLITLATGLAVAAHLVATEQRTAAVRDRLLVEAQLIAHMLQRRSRAELESEAFEKEIRALALVTGDRITIIGPDGKVLAESTRDPSSMDNHNTRPEVLQARRAGWGWQRRHSDTLGVDMLYVAVAATPAGVVARVATPLAKVAELAARLRKTFLLVTGAGLLVALLVGAWVTYGLSASLAELAAVARRLGAGDLKARARVRRKDEVGALSTALNQMAENIAEARQQLQRTSESLLTLIDHFRDPILLLDTKGRILLLNRAAARVLAVDASQAQGQLLEDLVPNYDLQQAVRYVLEKKLNVDVEIEWHGPQPRTFEVSAWPIELDEETRVCVVLRDFTRLRQLDRVRKDFVANASHELGTPVTAIRAIAETLLAGADEDTEVRREFLEDIVHNTQRLETIIADMLELARLEAGEEKILEEVDVGEVIEDVLGHIEGLAEASGLEIHVDLEPDLRVRGLRQNLETALVNLLDNAIKYAASGGRIEVRAHRDEGQVVLEVIDHGSGIPPGDRQRVFERFYRVDKARSRQLGGTGLGLSIVKHAVESTGGDIGVEDTPGGGATFVIRVPVA